jgi:hypothetical protein
MVTTRGCTRPTSQRRFARLLVRCPRSHRDGIAAVLTDESSGSRNSNTACDAPTTNGPATPPGASPPRGSTPGGRAGGSRWRSRRPASASSSSARRISPTARRTAARMARWIERRGAGRFRVGEALAATCELETWGLPGAGVGGVLQERCECLGELGYAVERGEGRPVAVGTGHGAKCMTASTAVSSPNAQPSHFSGRHLMHGSEEGAQNQVVAVHLVPR